MQNDRRNVRIRERTMREWNEERKRNEKKQEEERNRCLHIRRFLCAGWMVNNKWVCAKFFCERHFYLVPNKNKKKKKQEERAFVVVKKITDDVTNKMSTIFYLPLQGLHSTPPPKTLQKKSDPESRCFEDQAIPVSD